ncbi:FGGY family carbohydrate kinase [Fructilactobacillus fructivorans]|uniref:FGGY-family carbohydrate kinase n=1 Tax=Fructilactobacillus fructivorans TaxID=1614 RepID=UPI00070E73F2|nr:FGGY family carbohydrate kinase [Fructilactobacillus fructivorans]KRN40884.1 Actin-like ATPase domain-containing protein [Fructilactobacillus fructivorans]
MTQYIIGIDIGTSSTKAILMTTAGDIISQGRVSYSLENPYPEWAQENADDWLNAATTLIKDLAEKVDSKNIIGIGIDGLYGGSGVPVDKAGQPLGPALIWMDRRATEETDQALKLVSKAELMDITGNLADPYYGYTKIMWLKQHQPELYRDTYQFLPPESYVIYKLTGNISINYSAAGNLAGVFNINDDEWSPELADKLGIDLKKLPQKMIASTDVAGKVSDEWVQKLDINPGTPIFNTGVDVGPATVGTGVLGAGRMTIALGTSMNAALVTDKPLKDDNLIIWPYAYKPKEYYYNFAGANTAGAVIAWFTREFAQEVDNNNGTRMLDEESEAVPAGSNGLIVLPYFMGERSPIWDSNVRGTIFGISMTTKRYEMFNAFQEAIAYSVRQSIEQFGDYIGDSFTLVGGVSNSKKMVQIIADVTGKTVKTTDSGGEADLGSAILTGIGLDQIHPEDAEKWIKINEKVEPDLVKHEKYNKYYELYRLAYTDTKGFYEKYNELISK